MYILLQSSPNLNPIDIKWTQGHSYTSPPNLVRSVGLFSVPGETHFFQFCHRCPSPETQSRAGQRPYNVVVIVKPDFSFKAVLVGFPDVTKSTESTCGFVKKGLEYQAEG
ncbi:Hypothetical predicted protein [Scomber scombrus]|uniref:Uncharacterized protein n=1 Tax=Scomber scombrus TaxID=13677 RepID=A0AAV1QDT5_SCOSC